MSGSPRGSAGPPARPSSFGASLIGRERLLPIGVALLVLLGSLSAIAVPAPTGAVGGTTGRGDSPRLAVAGLENGGDTYDPGIGSTARSISAGAARLDFASDETAARPEGPYLADGTLLKPIAVDTSIADASDTLPLLPRPWRGHAHRDRPPFRRVDDDPVVGQSPQVER